MSSLVPMFVYGTLRVGQSNYRWAGMDTVDELYDVTAKGDLYWASRRATFPVADFDGSGTLKGDVLYYEPDSITLRQVNRMEEGAGYELRKITVTLPDSSTMTAFAWHYPYIPEGPKIPDGDWIRAFEKSLAGR